MSQQILRYPKTSNKSSLNLHKTFNTHQNKQINFTKVVNPLTTYMTNKEQFKQKQFYSTGNSTFHSKTASASFVEKQNHHKNQKTTNYQQKLKNPQYKFYTADLNSSSDASFLNTTFKSSRRAIQQKIVDQFNSQKNQIEILYQKSTQKSKKRHDKKQMKREKLKYYHCDSIMIRPAPSIHPVKVFDVVISPTKKNSQQNHFNKKVHFDQYDNHENLFLSNQYQSTNRNKSQKRFMQSLEESPFQTYQNCNDDHFMDESPSFLEVVQQVKQSSKAKIQFPSHKLRESQQSQNSYKSENFDKKSNQSYGNKQSVKSSNNSLQKKVIKRYEQNMQNIPSLVPFKKRNKIFTNEKKYGLKLSRAIKQEVQLQKLQGELGVDVFHIVFEEDQLLKQCCS